MAKLKSEKPTTEDIRKDGGNWFRQKKYTLNNPKRRTSQLTFKSIRRVDRNLTKIEKIVKGVRRPTVD